MQLSNHWFGDHHGFVNSHWFGHCHWLHCHWLNRNGFRDGAASRHGDMKSGLSRFWKASAEYIREYTKYIQIHSNTMCVSSSLKNNVDAKSKVFTTKTLCCALMSLPLMSYLSIWSGIGHYVLSFTSSQVQFDIGMSFLASLSCCII